MSGASRCHDGSSAPDSCLRSLGLHPAGERNAPFWLPRMHDAAAAAPAPGSVKGHRHCDHVVSVSMRLQLLQQRFFRRSVGGSPPRDERLLHVVIQLACDVRSSRGSSGAQQDEVRGAVGGSSAASIRESRSSRGGGALIRPRP